MVYDMEPLKTFLYEGKKIFLSLNLNYQNLTHLISQPFPLVTFI